MKSHFDTEYNEVELGQVCRVGDGAHSKVERKESGIPYITSKNIEVGHLDTEDVDYISEEDYRRIFPDNGTVRRPKPGDVLIGIIGSFGNAYRYTESDHFGISSAVGVLRPDESKLDSDFLYYVVTSDTFRAVHESVKGGSVQGYTNTDTIQSLPLVLPPLPVQRRIADILGALDDKIELNRRMNETLEEMARALYRHWFVDFGPFQDREFKDTEEMGPIPKGWEVKPLESIVTIELDNIDPQDFPDEEFDYYSFSAYDENRYPKLEVGGEIGSRKSLVKRRKVMVSRLNPGDYRIWTVYPDGDRRGITSTEFIHFVPNDPELWGYLNCHLRSEGFKAEFRRHASGTTGSRQRVRRRTPNDFGTVIPSEDVLETFGKRVNPVWDLIHFNREENQTLAETRDYLLPKLISGEIEVEAAQEVAEETVEATS